MFQSIWDKKIEKTYIIAEMSANHGGSLDRALEIIHGAKEAGADCVKLQTYTPDTMTLDCKNEYFQIKDGTWAGDTLYELYKKAYTPWDWQARLKEETEKLGMDFFSTPFDKSSVDFLEELGVECYKVASFELTDIPLIEYVASKGKPIILSTGMGKLEEISEAVEAISRINNQPLALLRCASAYPAVSSNMNLITMQHLKQTFGVPVGLSDHSLFSVAAIAAVAMGARIIEKHICISRNIKTPDSAFSLEVQEFKQMTEDIRQAERAIGRIHYGLTPEEQTNIKYRRSIFAVRDIKKGEAFTEENIKVIRPGYGLAPKRLQDILGMQAAKNIPRGVPIDESSLRQVM